jgi:hypothetical protein
MSFVPFAPPALSCSSRDTCGVSPLAKGTALYGAAAISIEGVGPSRPDCAYARTGKKVVIQP